jgi:hypothetical protein
LRRRDEFAIPLGDGFLLLFIPPLCGISLTYSSAREGTFIPKQGKVQQFLRGAENPIEDSCFERQLSVIFKLQIRGIFLRIVPRIDLQSLFFSSQKELASVGSDREVSVRLIALLQNA